MKTVLITLDCARADWLASNGSQFAEQAPYINKLAKRGVSFKNAITASNSTVPSHVSILTSTYPYVHGVKGNGMTFDCRQIPTLAEELSKGGITTAAFVSVEHLSSYFGLGRGFQHYCNSHNMDKFFYKAVICKAKIFGRTLLDILDGLRRRFKIFGAHFKEGEETLREATKWLHSNHEKDFFMWVHFFDAHNYKGRAGYEEQIRYVDNKVERLLTEVYKYTPANEVLVVITGDHGEAFENEHGFKDHISSLYDEVAKVPLAIVLPEKIQAQIVSEQVRTIDIAPSILGFYKMHIPENWQGINLYPSLTKKAPFNPLDALTYSYTFDLNAKSLRTEKWKMIYFNEIANYLNPAYGDREAVSHPYKVELYDLEKDKKETDNLADSNEQIIKELKARFFDLENRTSRIYAQEDFHPAIKKRLEDLGYL